MATEDDAMLEAKLRDRMTDVATRVLRGRDPDNFGRDARLGQIIGKVVGEAVADAIAQIDARTEARRDEIERMQQETLQYNSAPGSFVARAAAIREQGRRRHEEHMAQMRELHDRKLAAIRQRRAR